MTETRPAVLLVDDHAENLMVLEAVLADLDVDLVTAPSGEDALRRLLEREFAVILLDVQMPGMDGFQTAALVRERERNERTPIIFVTAIHNSDEHIFRGYEMGAVDYIVKPIRPRILRSKVAVFIDLYRKTDQVKRQAALLRDLEQREAERELAETREQLVAADQALVTTSSQLKTLIENLDEVYFSDDVASGRLLQIAPACEKIYGLPQQAFYERAISWRGLVYPDDVPIRHAMDRDLAAGRSVSYEYRIIRPDAQVRWVHARVKPTLDAEGRLVAVDGIVSDITERKLAEEKITEQAALLDVAQDAIITTDLHAHILFWNRSAETLYGWSEEEAIGRRASELLYQEAGQFDLAREAALQEGAWTGELQQVTRDGRAIVASSRWTLVRDAERHPKAIFIVNTDVTEKKQLEAQFLRAQRLESIGTLASGIAHDMNNVLGPILMALQTLGMLVNDETGRKLLGILESSVHRGTGIIKQVLSFARGSEGERSSLHLRYLMGEIERMVIDTFPRHIQVETHIPKDLWTIHGDSTQLYQVLMNLCVNARDAMLQGGQLTVRAENVELGARTRPLNADARTGSYVVVSVTDTGVGIPPEVVDKIFEPFFTTKEVGKGTGLGLSTAVGIVKSHGGFLTVHSTPGRGARFEVYLPASPVGAAEKLAADRHGVPQGSGDLVLVVDDEVANREVTRAALEGHGYRVLTAADGEEAVALFARHKGEIGAIITDMMMPNMDGAATIRAVRELDPEARVLAVSGIVDQARVAEELGTVTFLAKPYSSEALLETLHQVLKADVKRET